MATKQSVEEIFEKTEELEKRIKAVIDKITRIPALSVLGPKLGEARCRLVDFVESNGGSEEGVPESKRGTLFQYKELFELAFQKYKSAEEQDTSLRDELASLNEELAGINCSCSEKELLRVQAELLSTKASTEKAREAIPGIEKEIEQAESDVQEQRIKLHDLANKRANLLAKRFIGDNVDKELEAVDQGIAVTEGDIDKLQSIADELIAKNQPIIDGLKGIIVKSEERAARLADQIIPAALRGFLVKKAEVVGVEYAEKAKEVADKYRQLWAIGQLIGSVSNKKQESAEWDQLSPLRIHSFPTVSCKDVEGFTSIDLTSSVIEEERRELRAMGILV